MRIKIVYFFISLAIIDLIILNYFVFINKPVSQIPSAQPTPDQSALTTRISNLESAVTALRSVTPIPTVSAIKTQSPSAVRHISYLPINGSYNQLSYDWVNVPGSEFYFDTVDYPGLISVVFEANIKLFNGNGLAFAQLYDSTHAAPIPGGQVQTKSQVDTIVTSSPLTFLPGRNLIKVQIKSLTADTAYFNSGRLIITSRY